MSDMDYAWTAQVPTTGPLSAYEKMLAKKFQVSDNDDYSDDYVEFTRGVITDRNSDIPFLQSDMPPQNRNLNGQAVINLRNLGIRGSVDQLQGQELYLSDMTEGRPEYDTSDMLKRASDQNRFRARYASFGLSGTEPLPVSELVPQQKINRDLVNIRATMGNRFERTNEKQSYVYQLPAVSGRSPANSNNVRERSIAQQRILDTRSKNNGHQIARNTGTIRNAGLGSDLDYWKGQILSKITGQPTKIADTEGARPEGEMAFATQDEHKLLQLRAAIKTLMKHRYVMDVPNRDDQDYQDQLNTYVFQRRNIVQLINSIQSTEMEQLLSESFSPSPRGKTNIKAVGSLIGLVDAHLNAREQYRNKVISVRAPKQVAGVNKEANTTLIESFINPITRSYKSSPISAVVDHFMSVVKIATPDQKHMNGGKSARVQAFTPQVTGKLEHVTGQHKLTSNGKTKRVVQAGHQLRNTNNNGIKFGRDTGVANTPNYTLNRKPVSAAKLSSKMVSEPSMSASLT